MIVSKRTLRWKFDAFRFSLDNLFKRIAEGKAVGYNIEKLRAIQKHSEVISELIDESLEEE